MIIKQIYDIITKKTIDIPNGNLMKISGELGLDYTSVGRMLRGELKHVVSRYILPIQKKHIITLVDFETGKEYDCITCSSLSYYLGRETSENDSKYFYELIKGRQTSATICGIAVYLKNRPKTKRFINMKSAGLKYQQKKLEQNLKNKISSRLRCRIKNALRSNKKNKTQTLIGCNIDFLMGYLEKQFTLGMTWNNYGEWHIDHILPLSSFNLIDEIQQKKACHYSNLQPLWAHDNLSKGNKLFFDTSKPASP